MNKFKLESKFKPSGDQPKAIDELTSGIKNGYHDQILLGVTGSGKTFTMANVIEKIQKPTLIIAHNKTLAAQLCQEFREFFPHNSVGYFVSYYDYYQPEAYLPNQDVYIEKDADVNEEIDRLRHWATTELLSRKDVIIVASVSCIYGLGSPEDYKKRVIHINLGDRITRDNLIENLISLYYSRNQTLERGTFELKGSTLSICAPDKDIITRLEIENDKISKLTIIDKITRNIIENTNDIFIFPAKHFVVGDNKLERAIKDIRHELNERVKYFLDRGKIVEAERLERKTNYDLELMEEIGYCKGIENYSRQLTGRKPGEAPYTLIDYFPHLQHGNIGKDPDFLTIIDESHVTVPQIGAMYGGDRARKDNLIEYGFRLPSARDNRPLTFEEFRKKVGNVVYMSATPGKYELKKSCPANDVISSKAKKSQDSLTPLHFTQDDNTCRIIEQIIRPTGLVDPKVEIKPIEGQVDDVICEIEKEAKLGNKILVTTLTKKMAEKLDEYLKEKKIKSRYLHSEVDTLDRIRILKDLRLGKFDCLVGVNLLREGLDLPEVTLVAILDADKEGFLRSETSLVQTIGRAARNIDGRVILYADSITDSMKNALRETERRRNIQLKYNKKHDITPKTIKKNINSIIAEEETKNLPEEFKKSINVEKVPQIIKEKEKEMKKLAKDLRFEDAALIRDEIKSLKKIKI